MPKQFFLKFILSLFLLFSICQAEASPSEEEKQEYKPFINKGSIPLPIAPEVMESKEKPSSLKLKKPLSENDIAKETTNIIAPKENSKQSDNTKAPPPVPLKKKPQQEKAKPELPPLPLINEKPIETIPESSQELKPPLPIIAPEVKAPAPTPPVIAAPATEIPEATAQKTTNPSTEKPLAEEPKAPEAKDPEPTPNVTEAPVVETPKVQEPAPKEPEVTVPKPTPTTIEAKVIEEPKLQAPAPKAPEIKAIEPDTKPLVKAVEKPIDPDLQKFIKDESIMILFDEDDLVLGQLTETSYLDQIDGYKYLKLFEKELDYIQNIHKSIAIDNFITAREYYEEVRLPKSYLIKNSIAAIQNSNLNELRILADNYPILNMLDSNNNSLLHIATYNNNYYITKWLIMRGINMNILNNEAATALQIAQYNGEWAILNLLQEAGAE